MPFPDYEPTVPVFVRRLAERHGDRELIVQDARRLGFAEAEARSARLASERQPREPLSNTAVIQEIVKRIRREMREDRGSDGPSPSGGIPVSAQARGIVVGREGLEPTPSDYKKRDAAHSNGGLRSGAGEGRHAAARIAAPSGSGSSGTQYGTRRRLT